MKQINKDWDTIRKGSKVFLKEDTEFKGLLKGEKVLLEKGWYWINGFWANAVGLIKVNKDNEKKFKSVLNDEAIFSIYLKGFYR